MAGYAHPARASKWLIEVGDGLSSEFQQWQAQTVQLPELSNTVSEYGGVDGSTIKVAAREAIGDMTFEKLVPINKSDFFAFEWHKLCQSGLPEAYKKVIRVKRLGTAGTVVQTHTLLGCFPTTVARGSLDRMSDDNFIETMTLSVDAELQS